MEESDQDAILDKDGGLRVPTPLSTFLPVEFDDSVRRGVRTRHQFVLVRLQRSGANSPVISVLRPTAISMVLRRLEKTAQMD